jgi:soluble lytic murein transglycosylase-like protein
MNLYAYARNNPVTRFDPSGMVDEMGTGVVDPLATSGFEDYRLDSPQAGLAMLSAAWWYAAPQQPPNSGASSSGAAPTPTATPKQATTQPRVLTFEEVKEIVKENNLSGQPDEVIISVAWMESGFQPAAKNPPDGSGAVGLMQLRQPAAKDAGYDHSQLTDPAKNVQAGSKYLAILVKRNGGDLFKALASYRGGQTGPTYARKVLDCARCLRDELPHLPSVCLWLAHP